MKNEITIRNSYDSYFHEEAFIATAYIYTVEHNFRKIDTRIKMMKIFET